MERAAELERHGRVYGELRLAIAFTEGLAGDGAKAVTSKGWDRTQPLPTADFGAALLRNRGLTRNPAIVLAPSGLVGFDVDGPKGVELLKQLVPERLPVTVTVESGRDGGGWHFWFKRPAGATTAFVQLGEKGVQVKTGQYLIAPPALHPAGRVYRFADGRAPWDVPLALLPARILQRLERAANGNRERPPASDEPTTEGGRHDRLMRLGCAMRRRGACLQAVEAALLAENEHMCIPPQPTDTVRDLAQDLHERYGPAPA
jgi:hypothetical protein